MVIAAPLRAMVCRPCRVFCSVHCSVTVLVHTTLCWPGSLLETLAHGKTGYTWTILYCPPCRTTKLLSFSASPLSAFYFLIAPLCCCCLSVLPCRTPACWPVRLWQPVRGSTWHICTPGMRRCQLQQYGSSESVRQSAGVDNPLVMIICL